MSLATDTGSRPVSAGNTAASRVTESLVQTLVASVPRAGVAGLDSEQSLRHLRCQREVMERILRGAPLADVLESLTLLLEEFLGRHSVMIAQLEADDRRLQPVAGGRCPAGWRQLFRDFRVGPSAGSCGTAVFLRERVVATNIAEDLRWIDYRAEAARHGLAACWSTPIVARDGRVLGTLAVYSAEPAAPGVGQLELIDDVVRTAALAIEKLGDGAPLDDTARSEAEFLDQLSQDLGRCSDANEIMRCACEAVGRHLGTQRCYLPEWQDDLRHVTVRHDWFVTGASSIAGTYDLENFGPASLRERMIKGAVAVEDVELDPVARDFLPAYRMLGIHAFATSRFVRGQHSAATLAVASHVPRVWTVRELALIENAVVRIWPLVERTRAEENVRAVARRLTLAMKIGRLGDWTWDAASNTITLSGTPAEIIGLPSGTKLTRAALRSYVHPDDVDPVRQIVEQAMAAQTDYQMEYRLRRPTGEYAWMAVQGAGIFAPDGTLTSVIGVMQEITERKEAEEKLRAQETQLRFISSNAPAILSHLDRAGRFLFVNKAFADRWKAEPSAILGKTIAEIAGPEALVAVQPYIDRVLRGETVEFESEVDYGLHGRRFMRATYAPDIGPDGQVRGWLSAAHDLTERWQAEQALRESEERVRLITRAGKLGLWSWEIATNRVAWSESLFEIHGVKPGEFNPTLEGFATLVHPEDRGPVERAIQSTLEHDVPYELEFRVVRPAGGTIWVFANGVVLRDAQKRPVRMHGATLDITARKTAEFALRESEGRFRALASHASVGIFLTDPNGDFLFVNESWRAMAGVTVELARGRGWLRVLHPDDRERVEAEWGTALQARRPFAAEYRFRRPDGSVLWLQGSAVEFRGAAGGRHGYIGTVVDLTERKAAEDALRESEKRFRALASHAPVGIFLTDPQGATVLVNESWSAMTGLTLEEARGEGWMRAIHPDDRWRVLSEWQEAVRQGVTATAEYRFLRSDGSVTWVQGRAVQMRDAAGRLAGYIGTIADFTARKRIEEKLRAQEAQLRLITNNVPVILAHCDREERYLFANRAFTDRFGCEPEEVLGRTIAEVLGAPARAVLEPYVRRVLAGETVSFELDIPYRDIGVRYMRISYTPEIAEDGTVRSWLSAIADITERRQMEKALRDSEERFRTLADNIAQFAWMNDASGRRQWINQRFIDFTGLTAGEIEQGKALELHHPEHRERVIAKYQEHLARGEPWEDIFPLRGRDGQYRWFLSRALPIRDAAGRVTRWFGTNTDVTQLRETETALQKHNERLQLISEALATLLDAKEPGTLVQELLPRVARHLEADAYFNFMVTPAGDALALHAYGGISQQQAETMQRLEFGQAICGTVAQTCQAIYATDIQHSGFEKAVLVRGFGIQAYACNPFIVDNRLIGTLSFATRTRPEFQADELEFMRSISRYVALVLDRARAQEQLQAHALELEHRVDERTASLREAIVQMEEFSYSVSHDLRAPLRAMNAYAQALVEDYSGQLDATAKDYLDRIRRSSQRMERLTHDVLTYSRIARAELPLARVDPARLIQDLILQYSELQAPRARVELVGEILAVRGHDVSLGQCLANLLTNAAKFVAPGIQPHIRVRSESAGADVRLWIEDNGIGIEPRYHERLFRVFERISTKQAYDGTGIGLAIVRKAVDKMGGRCGVESDGVSGSRFWIELPAA